MLLVLAIRFRVGTSRALGRAHPRELHRRGHTGDLDEPLERLGLVACKHLVTGIAEQLDDFVGGQWRLGACCDDGVIVDPAAPVSGRLVVLGDLRQGVLASVECVLGRLVRAGLDQLAEHGGPLPTELIDRGQRGGDVPPCFSSVVL